MTHILYEMLTMIKLLAGVPFPLHKAVYSWHCILCSNPHVDSLLNVNHAGLEAEAVGGLLIC